MKRFMLLLVFLAAFRSCATPVLALQKNVAGQTVAVHLWDSGGADVTTGTTTCYVVTDAGTESAGAVATHEGHGTWSYAITQAETNGDHVSVTCTNSSAVTAAVQTYTIPDPLENDVPGSYSANDAGYVLYNLQTTLFSEISEGVLVNQPTATSTIIVYRGDAQPLTLNLGSDWPLTGKEVYFTAKNRPTADNADAIVNRTAMITDAAGGVATITLTTTETAATGRYYYDVTVQDTGDPTTARTAKIGELVIKQDVYQ